MKKYMKILNTIIFFFLSIHLININGVESNNKSSEKSKLIAVHLLINTEEESPEGIPFDSDYENHAVYGSFISLLLKKKPQELFITYGLLNSLKNQYTQAIEYFKSLGIIDPLNQIALQPKSGMTYWARPIAKENVVIEKALLPFTKLTEKAGKIHIQTTQTVAFFRHPDEVFTVDAKKMDKENCSSYCLTKEYNGLELNRHLKTLLMLNQGWCWYDTQKGLYHLTKANSPENPIIGNIEQFVAINPLEEVIKKDTNSWIHSLENIFKLYNECHYALHINGHGSEIEDNPTITAGLSNKNFSSLFTYLNNHTPLDLVVITSCYTTSKRPLKITQIYEDIENFNYPVVSSISDSASVVHGPSQTSIELYNPTWYENTESPSFSIIKEDPVIYRNLKKLHKKVLLDKDCATDSSLPSLMIFLKKRIWHNANPSILPAKSNSQIKNI